MNLLCLLSPPHERKLLEIRHFVWFPSPFAPKKELLWCIVGTQFVFVSEPSSSSPYRCCQCGQGLELHLQRLDWEPGLSAPEGRFLSAGDPCAGHIPGLLGAGPVLLLTGEAGVL